jgi:predicted acylesterase/phospholipase RssA
MEAGTLRALYQRGIAPDLLAGTSAGALNAAFLASRPPTVGTAGDVAAIWCGLRRTDVLPLRPRIVGVCWSAGRTASRPLTLVPPARTTRPGRGITLVS